MGIRFEFDPAKAETNRTKHGVSFEEATEVFGDAFSLTIVDKKHSKGEERFITVGQTRRGALLVIVHKDKADCIRIISARMASAHERKAYEQKT